MPHDVRFEECNFDILSTCRVTDDFFLVVRAAAYTSNSFSFCNLAFKLFERILAKLLFDDNHETKSTW